MRRCSFRPSLDGLPLRAVPSDILTAVVVADVPPPPDVPPQDPAPDYPYPPINGEPPLYPPLIPGGPMGPG